MTIREFLWELANFFPISQNAEKVMDKYTDILVEFFDENPYRYDLQKLLDYLLVNSKYKTFPTIQTILEATQHAVICSKIPVNKYYGWKVRIYFNNGKYSDFIICRFGINFNEIKERCKLSDKVKKAVMYPPKVTIKDEETGQNVIVDVALIGDKVFPANTPSKVLYIAS